MIPEITMAFTSVSPSRDTELIDLQQQVARLQALLEATRQVHSATSLEQVLLRVLEIVVRGAGDAGGLVHGPSADVRSDTTSHVGWLRALSLA